MIRNIYIIVFIFCTNIFYISTSVANPQKIVKNVICKEKTVFKKFLENNQEEQLIWFGISTDGSTLTELYESIKTKTWTILETNTNGISCATIGGDASTFLKVN